MGRVSACCCCFANNVRHLVLLLSLLVVSSLFANLSLFNLTAVFHQDIDPRLKPVSGLDSLHEYTLWHDRRRRSINATQVEKEGFPVLGVKEDDEGHPILPPIPPTTTVATTTTVSTVPTTPRLIFLSNSPTATRKWTTRVVRGTTEQPTETTATTTTTITTTTAAPTTRNVVLEEVQKAIDKYENKDKDVSTGDAIDKTPLDKPKVVLAGLLVERMLVYGAPGVGCLLGLVAASLLFRVVGVRSTMAGVLVLSAIVTIATPFVVPLGFAALLPVRLLAGACFSASLPFVGSLAANWGTLKEQLSFVVISFLFITVAPACSWPLTGLLHSNEFPLVVIYAIHAAVALFAALAFLIFYRDRPQHHPWVNGLELNRIVAGKVHELKQNRALSAPLPQLLRSLSAWAIWLAAFAFFSGLSLFSCYLPSFLSCQQVFMVESLGFHSALPFLPIPLVFIAGGLLNNLSCSSTTVTVRVMNTASFVLTAALLASLPILFHLDKSGIAFPVMVVALAPLGFSVCGFLRSAVILGRVYSQHIIAGFAVSFGLAQIALCVLVNTIVFENGLSEWMRVFFGAAGILAVVAVMFAFLGRGRSATWAESSWDPLVSTRMHTLNPIDISQDECGLYEMRHIGKQKR